MEGEEGEEAMGVLVDDDEVEEDDEEETTRLKSPFGVIYSLIIANITRMNQDFAFWVSRNFDSRA